MVICLVKPAVEELGLDESDVAVEGSWIDLLQLLGKAGKLGESPLFVLFGQVLLLGPVRLAGEFRLGDVPAVVVQCA
ncbi:hypothetical protein ACFXCZ_32015 [Streptomyces sp. NPDC059396]|uniref:hypothetical protein n=1 Tax=Streptomyces sp. NPDC059396 TaxID=3346819 RepID=UPI0036B27BF7